MSLDVYEKYIRCPHCTRRVVIDVRYNLNNCYHCNQKVELSSDRFFYKALNGRCVICGVKVTTGTVKGEAQPRLYTWEQGQIKKGKVRIWHYHTEVEAWRHLRYRTDVKTSTGRKEWC